MLASDRGDECILAQQSSARLMTRISFFATKNDLLLALCDLEAKRKIKYTRAGRIEGPEPQVWETGANLPGLGRAAGDQAVDCDSFLILDGASVVAVVSQETRNGDDRYDLEQAQNPDSVIVYVGGEWVDGSLISGGAATNSETPLSQSLMRAIHSGIKKHFSRVQAFWVGPEALASLRAGKRLTYAVQSPPEYDLFGKVA
jgi:hypothetical protein